MISIIKYSKLNIEPLADVLRDLNQDFLITNNEYDICKSEKVIFPAEGDTPYAIRQLHILNMFTLLRIVKKPILGISLGMQLLCNFSEDSNISCLGIFPATVKKTEDEKPAPGMQEIKLLGESKLFKGIHPNDKFFFDNTFYVPTGEYTTAVLKKDSGISASLEKHNYYGVQFRPELSGSAGKIILENFINLPKNQ